MGRDREGRTVLYFYALFVVEVLAKNVGCWSMSNYKVLFELVELCKVIFPEYKYRSEHPVALIERLYQAIREADNIKWND